MNRLYISVKIIHAISMAMGGNESHYIYKSFITVRALLGWDLAITSRGGQMATPQSGLCIERFHALGERFLQ